MRKSITLLFFLFTGIIAMAQNSGVLKGKLVDSVGKQSLKDASISVLDPKDSTLEVFGLSLSDGTFTVKNITFGTYLVHISFQSYEPIFKHITINQTDATINLGTIYLKIASDLLPGVTVTQAPIVIRKDTIEYNAASFKTKPNAVAEDLLKKMPGIDVDKSGNITAQGESVKRVLVDGKRFFGDDPKMATRNLPPDVIDKVQVFDDLSDQSKFTGFDDGNRVKTINLTTRKDKRKGYFGKAVVSDGSNGKYDESANIHRFNGSQQISLIGQANDVNKQNFTGGGGGGGGNGGSSSGITTTTAAGANYRDSWGKTNTTDLSGSYFYNDLNTLTDRQSNSQYLPQSDTSVISNSNSSSASNSINHRLNFNLESKIDSINSLVFRPGISFTHSTPNSSSQSLNTQTNGDTLYSTINKSYSTNDGFSINGTNLQLRHRFNKRYRTLSLDINYSANESKGDGFNYAINNFKKPIQKLDTINQYYNDTSHSYSISPTLSYTEPLGKNSIFEFRYNFSYSNNTNINNTFRYAETSHNYTFFDSLFSNSYKFNSTSNNVTLSYRLQKTNYNFNIGSGIQFTDRNNSNTTKKINTSQHFVNLTPTANFQYTFTKTSNLRIFYSGRTGQPSISQLQPLTTTTDSINFQVGNPNLKQQFTHSLRALYSNFDVVTQRVIFATINFSTIVNDIQSSVVNNANKGRTTTNVNLNGTYNLSGYFNYGFPLRRPKSNLSFATNINYSQAQSLIDGASNFTKNTSLGENIKWTTNLKDNFDMNFSANSTYNIARYTLMSTSNANYYSLGLSTDFTYYTDNGWLAAADFDYTYSGNHTAGYNTSIPLLNPSIAKQFLKNKAGELRLTCFDLLNANKSVTRTVSSTQITDSRTNVLTQYFLLTFTYNLRRFPGAGANTKGQMRGMRGDGGGDRGERGGGGGGNGGGGFGGGGRRN
jgi:uncharacterized membrane protein YgcG